MTYKEYIKETERKKTEREGLKTILIIFCVVFILASMFICTDKCSDTVFSWVMGLNFWIWIFCFSILELKEKKDKLELELLSKKITGDDAL
jgi:hypothetical protein